MDLKKTTIISYDRTAEDYDKIVNSFEILPQLELFSKMFSKGDRILDLGCGPGQHSKYFSDCGFDVSGIDLSEKMISIAKRKYSDIDFQVMDIENLDFKNNTFDGIWASASILHIEKEKIPHTLLRLSNILKDNGIIYISLKLGFGAGIISDERYGGVQKFYSFFQKEEFVEMLDANRLILQHTDVVQERNKYDTNSWLHLFIKKNAQEK